jgi:membrane protein EpsK
MTELEPLAAVESGAHERHLAISTLAQQAVQVVATLTMLGVVTILARRLSLAEFGTYGLLVSLTTYVLFIQGSISTATVKAIAEASDDRARERTFSTAISLYVIAGVGAGLILAVVGSLLLRIFNIPARLDHQAQLSVLALGVLIGVSWPPKIFQDLLRGRHQFVDSATAEVAGYVLFAAVLVALVVQDAPLWILVLAGASAPLAISIASTIVVLLKGVPFRFRRALVSRASMRGLLGLSTYLSVGGLSGIVIYSLDRAILAAFRSPATVALYEGPVRAHNLVQQFNAALSVPLIPTSSRYLDHDDIRRVRDLLLRGTRYTLALIVPLSLTFVVLARPILTVWLGPKYAVAATAMSILVSYWLLNAGLTVGGAMLISAGRARAVAMYSAAIALLNLTLSLALTSSLGLNGVVLGTTLSYVLGFPFALVLILSTFPVSLGEIAREAWVPAYVTGAIIALLLVAVRIFVPLESLLAVAAAGCLAVLLYWAIFYAAWLRPGERTLVKSVALGLVRRS